MTDAVPAAPSDGATEAAEALVDGPAVETVETAEGLEGAPLEATDGAGLVESTAPDTTGQAISAIAEAAELAEAGGPVVLILAAMSVFALAIVLAKIVQFAAARVGDRRSAREALSLLRQGHAREAYARATASRAPSAVIVAQALEGQARGIPEAKVREDCYAEAQIRLEALRGWMRPLEVVATLAPLLGLLGTVLGMIKAFAQLEAAGSQVDPSILSGGIWEALLTTAVGLAVAIPTVAAVNWFERRIERVEHDIDTGLAALFATDWEDVAPAPRGRVEGSYGDAGPALRPAAAGE